MVDELEELKGAIGEYKRGLEELEKSRLKDLEEIEKLVAIMLFILAMIPFLFPEFF